VWSGVARGGVARVPGEALLAASAARLRLIVSDGFRETTATSARFTITGHRPRVQISEPRTGARIDAGGTLRLQGGALDDRGRVLTGRRLVWRAGRTVLGRGESVTTALPSGARRVTLRATDARGRSATASVTVRTRATTPYFLTLAVSGRAPRRGGTVTLRVAATQPGTVRVGGRRVRVGRTTTSIRVRVPAGRDAARLTVRLNAGGATTTSTLLVSR
jgi:hypothetical protein